VPDFLIIDQRRPSSSAQRTICREKHTAFIESILPPEDWEGWLDPAHHDPAAVQPMLAPYKAELMTATAVNPIVNSRKLDRQRASSRLNRQPAHKKARSV
jgi:hypothetical protein